MPLTYVEHKKLSLRNNPDFSESWLHDKICESPFIIGLGELEVVQRERVQLGGGRLDMLLADYGNDIRYEVEIMLGATDASHIIRCIEYWDIERRRYPGYEHVAVLVAEEITSRFLNVVSLLSGTIAIVAIQLNALKVGENIILNFVKVLDQRDLRVDDTAGIEGDDVDRTTWVNKKGEASINICDRILELANEVAEPPLELKFKKTRVALATQGSFFNVAVVVPKTTHVIFSVSLNERDVWHNRLDEAGLDVTLGKGNRLKLRLRAEDLIENANELRELIQKSVQEFQAR